MKRSLKRRQAEMLRFSTPVEDYEEFDLLVKREDMSCKPPGPPFSKTRGVFAHVASRPEQIIGVLDTGHSQAGHAVARACQLLDKDCINFYPVYVREGKPERNKHVIRPAQIAARKLGAALKPLKAGRSCILFHAARKFIEEQGGYMMPNALKLNESVSETAKEVTNCPDLDMIDQVLIPISSGTIAAGVIKGYFDEMGSAPLFLIHLGYSRSHEEVQRYLEAMSGVENFDFELIDESYSYKDKARFGDTPPFPCNEYYDLKAFRWWCNVGRDKYGGRTLLWNIG